MKHVRLNQNEQYISLFHKALSYQVLADILANLSTGIKQTGKMSQMQEDQSNDQVEFGRNQGGYFHIRRSAGGPQNLPLKFLLEAEILEFFSNSCFLS